MGEQRPTHYGVVRLLFFLPQCPRIVGTDRREARED